MVQEKDGKGREGETGRRLNMGFPCQLGDESVVLVFVGVLFVVLAGCLVWLLY